MKNIGIWLDTRSADIIILNKGGAEVKKINSDIEDYHAVGGYGSSVPFLGQDAISESKILARKNLQATRYFDEISAFLKDETQVYIFGPGNIKIGLTKHIKNIKTLKVNILAIENADKMTLPQKIAKVKKIFGVG